MEETAQYMANGATPMHYNYPRVKFVDTNQLHEQLDHVESEMGEIVRVADEEELIMELLDLQRIRWRGGSSVGGKYEVRFYFDENRNCYQSEYTNSLWKFIGLIFLNRKRLIYFTVQF